MTTADRNERPDADDEIARIAAFAAGPSAASDEARNTARLCLMDSVACALMAAKNRQCQQRLGPVAPGAETAGGARVIAKPWKLDPVQAAFNNGALVRWLDFNDTWLAAEWGHPSDNLGAILSVADFVAKQNRAQPQNVSAPPVPPVPTVPAVPTVSDILGWMIKAHEIQGVLALENAFNRAGLDHVLLVKVASAALATVILGGDEAEVVSAVSHAWADGPALRTYRHAPNAGPRKSWAAGDACARGVRMALLARNGETAIPSALTAPTWGFCDAVFRGKKIVRQREYGSYVMENILFKVSFPAEFHAQTAVECAVKLHPRVRGRIGDIARVEMETQESAVRIISKSGPLYNYADRDHCLQYMTAVGLLFGELTEGHYEDEAAADPRIDSLREKMSVAENPRYSRDYLDPDKRSIANSVQVFFADGTATDKVEVEYPLGHRRRRAESVSPLWEKFRTALAGHPNAEKIDALFSDSERLDATAADALADLLAAESE